jgi:biopolymer transport protein ExbD
MTALLSAAEMHMLPIRLIAFLVVLASLVGCQKEEAAKPNMNTLKIKVSAAGEITIDGQAASLDQTATKLADLKKANGAVLYHRENPQGEPHPNAMKVIKLVTDNQLPICLCAQADFSDSVDEKGVSRPGK